MSALDDYLKSRSRVSSYSASNREPKKFMNLLRTVNTYNVNRKAGEALSFAGADIDPNSITGTSKPGLMSTVFKGLDLPRNLVFTGLGRDPELRGGDVFKQEEDDNLLTKAGKFAGAFAFDVATDPLTFVGAPGVIGRKAVTLIAASKPVRKAALNVGEEALLLSGRNADDVVESLYRANPVTRLRTKRAEFNLNADEVAKVDAYTLRRKDIITSGVAEDAADRILRRELAEEELGRIMSESLLIGGRKPLIDNLTKVFGSEDVARKVFKSLPTDVRGGAVVRGITGKTLGSVPGTGQGATLGKTGEAINRMRFNLSQKTDFGGAGLSGILGPSWSEVRTGLSKVMKGENFDLLKDNLGRTTITAFNDFKIANNNMKRARTAGLFEVWRVVGAVNATRRSLADSSVINDFDKGLYNGFNNLESTVTRNAAEEEGFAAATKLRVEMDKWKNKQVEAGIPINDMGPDFVPLMPTPEEWLRIQERTPRGSGTSLDILTYNASKGRDKYIVPKADADKNGWSGYPMPDNPDLIALDAKSINLKEGRKAFVEDPVQIAEKYMESAARKVANRVFINESLRAGVLVADVDYVKKEAQLSRLSTYINAVRKTNPQLSKQVQSARNKIKEELTKVTAKDVRDRTIKENAENRAKFNAAYLTAKAKLSRSRGVDIDGNIIPALPVEYIDDAGFVTYTEAKTVTDELTEAKQALDKARNNLTVNNVARTYDEYAQSGVVQRSNLAKEEAQKTGRKFASDKRRLDEYNKTVDEYRELVPEFGDEAQNIADEAFRKADETVDDFVVSKELKEEAAFELDTAKAIQKLERTRFAQNQIRAVDEHVKALEQYNAVLKKYEKAVEVRNAAKVNYDKARKAPNVESDEIIQSRAADYAEKNFKLIQAEQAKTFSKEQLKELRKARNESLDILKESIGYDFEKTSPLNMYRSKIIELADKLSKEEFKVATVMASEPKLVELVDSMSEAFANGNMEDIAKTAESIKESYFNLRNIIKVEDLTDLNVLEAKALKQGLDDTLKISKNVEAKSEYGKWLIDEDIKQIAAGVDGGSVSLPSGLAGLHATSGVRRVLENMYRAETTTAFRKFTNKAIDPLLLIWKTGVTVGRGPAYTMTNLIGGVYMSFLGGVSTDSMMESARILVAFKSAYKEAQDKLPTRSAPEQLEKAAELLKIKLSKTKVNKRAADEVLREFLENGGYGSSQTAYALRELSQEGINAPVTALQFGETVRINPNEVTSTVSKPVAKVVNLALTNPYQRVMNDLAQGSELFLRFSTYVDSIKKFNDPTLALDRVNLLHFDYSDLSSTENSIRRLVPFYTWSRHNVPLQLRAMFLEPGKIKKWMYAQDNIKEILEEDEDSWYSEMLPEYLQNVNGFVSSIGTEAGPLAFGSRMPYTDIDRLFKVGGFPVNMREATSMAGPLATVPSSLAFDVNMDTGARFNPEGVEATGYKKFLSYLPFAGNVDATGERRLSSKLDYALTEAVPQIGFVDRALSTVPVTSGLASGSQQERSTSNFLNLLGIPQVAGLGATTLTVSSMTGEARSRIEKQNKIINQTAGKMGISTEWLREQIRKGYTSQQIAALIRRGEGRLEEYEEQKNRNKKGLDPRYARMLGSMRDGQVNLGY